jgi:regulator of sigma D
MDKTHALAQPAERRNRTLQTIATLVAQRREMLVLFCRVAGLPPYRGKTLDTGTMHRFCQVLTDYVAGGHFGLYERIIEGRERRRGVVRLAEKLYPRIAQTTQKAVDFSDRYAAHPNPSSSVELAQILSELGEDLALRAELEDELIAELCPDYNGSKHQRLAAKLGTEPTGQP